MMPLAESSHTGRVVKIAQGCFLACRSNGAANPLATSQLQFFWQGNGVVLGENGHSSRGLIASQHQ